MGGNTVQRFDGRLSDLEEQTAFVLDRTGLSLFRSALFLRGLFLLLFLGWLFIPHDGRRIPCYVPDELIREVFLHQCVMDFLAQVITSEFSKGAGEGRLGRDIVLSDKSADHTEIRHGVEHLNKHSGRGEIIDRFGDKSPCDGASVFRCSAHPTI